MEERKITNKEHAAVKAKDPVTIGELVQWLTPEAKTRLLARYNMKNFAKIFEDADLCDTCLKFFDCGLNVSLTAREKFMHRNTLIYRLDKVKHLTGLDIRDINAAVTFELLYSVYSEIRSNSR